MIIVNGIPKSGTHAVMAWFTRMGMQRHPGTLLPAPNGVRAAGVSLEQVKQNNRPGMFILAHVPATRELWGNVVTVFRDPRNMLVSYCRHREREDGFRPTLAEAIRDYWGQPFVPLYDSYLGWKGRSVVIYYEDLPPAQIGDGGSIYVGHDRDWNTRTGEPSDWRNEWNDEAEDAWRASDGPGLLRRSGYASTLRIAA